MKANQFYRQWITDYRKEKNDRSGEPIQDGDLLDWIAEKFELGEFSNSHKHSVVRGGANEAVIVHGDNTITEDKSQTTTLTAPTEPLPAEGEEKSECGRFYTDEEIDQIKSEFWEKGLNAH